MHAEYEHSSVFCIFFLHIYAILLHIGAYVCKPICKICQIICKCQNQYAKYCNVHILHIGHIYAVYYALPTLLMRCRTGATAPLTGCGHHCPAVTRPRWRRTVIILGRREMKFLPFSFTVTAADLTVVKSAARIIWRFRDSDSAIWNNIVFILLLQKTRRAAGPCRLRSSSRYSLTIS